MAHTITGYPANFRPSHNKPLDDREVVENIEAASISWLRTAYVGLKFYDQETSMHYKVTATDATQAGLEYEEDSATFATAESTTLPANTLPSFGSQIPFSQFAGQPVADVLFNLMYPVIPPVPTPGSFTATTFPTSLWINQKGQDRPITFGATITDNDQGGHSDDLVFTLDGSVEAVALGGGGTYGPFYNNVNGSLVCSFDAQTTTPVDNFGNERPDLRLPSLDRTLSFTWIARTFPQHGLQSTDDSALDTKGGARTFLETLPSGRIQSLPSSFNNITVPVGSSWYLSVPSTTNVTALRCVRSGIEQPLAVLYKEGIQVDNPFDSNNPDTHDIWKIAGQLTPVQIDTITVVY